MVTIMLTGSLLSDSYFADIRIPKRLMSIFGELLIHLSIQGQKGELFMPSLKRFSLLRSYSLKGLILNQRPRVPMSKNT